MNSQHSSCEPIHPPVKLSDEQRVLLEQVTSSPTAFAPVRKRAKALLLIEQGLSFREIHRRLSTDRRTLASLVRRHLSGGLRAALLGQNPSLERRQWLALSPMAS